MASAFLKRILRVANGLHVALYRLSGGKFANRIAGLPILLITTFGRKSGKPHTNPVVYLKDGQDYLVSASAGGMDWQPGWYLNLKNKPEARIQIGDQAFSVRATITDGEERTRLYEKFKAASSNFVKYEKGTSRVIPVIRLTPNKERAR
ncbi:MAG: nitroreductase family deazaflavin-dependent oxidoreductase [Anaerolineae bacterium]|nr:nitroreductase family deazaflavin-dependent oxidoreductase [Anaerolineae bacterium]